MTMRVWMVWIVVAGCDYRPTFGDCEVACAADDCPDGFTCGSEGLCRIVGAVGSCTTPPGAQTVTLRQTLDDVIAADASSACFTSVTTRDNHWYRLFPIARTIHVTRVTLGIQEASAAANVLVRIGVYAGPVAPALDLARSQQLGMAEVTLPAVTNRALVDASIDATLEAGDVLLAEVFAPAYAGPNAVFFLGATAAGDTQRAYWSSAACGQPIPMTTAVSVPTPAVILEVTGTEE